jgi:hypothetical protein
MKTKFKVGQEVECLIYGKGVVKEITNSEFGVLVFFYCNGNVSYTHDGRFLTSANPTLTPGTWKVEEILPEPPFEKGQPVWFKNNVDDFWKLRYYSHKENRKHFVFMLQQKEGATHACEFVKPFEGVDPNQ